jgi:hypothetical protein
MRATVCGGGRVDGGLKLNTTRAEKAKSVHVCIVCAIEECEECGARGMDVVYACYYDVVYL